MKRTKFIRTPKLRLLEKIRTIVDFKMSLFLKGQANVSITRSFFFIRTSKIQVRLPMFLGFWIFSILLHLLNLFTRWQGQLKKKRVKQALIIFSKNISQI